MRIGSSLYGVDLAAQNSLSQSFSRLAINSVRVSTMRKINSGADDPAGVINVGQLEAELTAIEKASYNASRATVVCPPRRGPSATPIQPSSSTN